MKNKSILKTMFLSSLGVIALSGCGQHVHSYDTENPVWEWNAYASATATFTCTSCKEDAEGHSVTINASIKNEETKKASCIVKGEKAYTATVTFEDKAYSNSKVKEIEALGHDVSSSWSSDETKHWHACSRCDYKEDEASHDFSNWEIVSEATYKKEGLKERVCTICSYSESAPIEKLTYSYEEVKASLEKALTYEPSNPFAKGFVNDALAKYEEINPTQKQEHLEELEGLYTKVKALSDQFSARFETLIDIDAMNTYDGMKTEVVSNDIYGNVLKVNSLRESGEGWEWGSPRSGLDVTDYAYLTFAVFAPRPMDITITDATSNWLDVNTGEVVHKNTPFKGLTVGGWTTIKIPSASYLALGDFHIGLYTVDDKIPYGIALNGDPAYISEVVGVKQSYVDSLPVKEMTSSFTYTQGWGAEATLVTKNDETYGNCLEIEITKAGGVLELNLGAPDNEVETGNVKFSIKFPVSTAKFTLSKQDWWREAYDFSTNTFVTSGDSVTYRAESGWNTYTMKAEDYNEIRYLGIYLQDTFSVGNKILVTNVTKAA